MSPPASPPQSVTARRRARRRPSPHAPSNLRARAITSASVALAWDPPPAHAARRRHDERYEVLRDGGVLARVWDTFFNDTAVAPTPATAIRSAWPAATGATDPGRPASWPVPGAVRARPRR